jgi:hypothetical protein
MAIMTEQKHRIGGGMMKILEEGAEDLAFLILQKTQYQYPFKSTVREVMSNGLDSIQEKHVAMDILSGRAKVEDYYEEREGAIYKDSKFNPSYYDLKWLNPEDRVELRYIVRPGQRDQVVISDTGVGLYGRRLQGYLSLMYSTKRLNKNQLGKYGLGAKSALSTGEDFFTTESCYNGRKYRFNVYLKSYDSIIPRFNLVTGQENFKEVWNEGTEFEYVVYSEPTEELNGVKIFIDAKKHHRNEYVEAVKSQMLYFNNVYLTIVQEDGREEPIPFQADILYEDEYLVLAKQNYYSKPHILLNKVNYGYVDWSELELEDKKGNIGIKVFPEEVEVNPNRESVVWNDLTKRKVQERLQDVQQVATRLVQEQLQTNDFLEWYRLCTSISTWFGRSGDNVVARLANMVDITELKPRFTGNTCIQFGKSELTDPAGGLWMRLTKIEKNLKANKQVTQVKREQVKWLGDGIKGHERPIVIMRHGERASNRKDKYLCSLYPSGFIGVYEPYSNREDAILAGASEKELEYLHAWLAKNSSRPYTREDVFNLICASHGVIRYEEVEVPESFKGTEEEEDKVEDTVEQKTEIKVAQQSAEERRKLEGRTVLFTPRVNAYGLTKVEPNGPADSWQTGGNGTPQWTSNSNYEVYYEAFTFHKLEVPIAEINTWDTPEIYYGFDADRELLHCAAILSRDPHPDNVLGASRRMYSETEAEWKEKKWCRLNQSKLQSLTTGNSGNQLANTSGGFDLQHFLDTDVMLVKIAQGNQKYYRDFLHISNFFMRIKDKQITMSNTLVRWNTARIIKEKLQDAAFLRNWSTFDEDYATKFHLLQNYVDMHYRSVDKSNVYGIMGEGFTTLLTHLDNVRLFQEYIHSNPEDKAGIAQIAGELFGNRELEGAQSVDMFMIDMLRTVLDYARACGPIFNYITPLTTFGANIPFDLEQEIKGILAYKNILLYENRPILTEPGDPGEDSGVLLSDDEDNSVELVVQSDEGAGVSALV